MKLTKKILQLLKTDQTKNMGTIKSKLIFIRWLKTQRSDKNLYRKFKDNLQNLYGQSVSIISFIDDDNPLHYIEMSFDWEKTPEGAHFWRNIDFEWKKYCRANGIKKN